MESERKVAVLLVDDQPNNLLALEAILGGMDQDLVRARSGEEALMRVLDADFAVILMDVQMPGLDGFETATLIRERDRSQHTPIIFLTAFQSDEGQVFQGYKLGAVDFLSKPIVPTVLRSKVGVFVELFQKAEQVRLQADQLHQSQRREHERELAEEKRRWELERFREEAIRERKAAEAMTQKAEELSRTVAERARAEEQLRERAAQQAIVAGLGQQALSGLDLVTLLDEALAQAAGNLQVGFGVVKELAPDGQSLGVRASLGLEGAGGQRALGGVGTTSLAGFTLLSGEPVVVEDFRAETRFAVSPLLRERGVRSGLCVIIQAGDSPFGTLAVLDGRPKTFSPDDVNFLQAVANVLAAAVQRRRDEQDLAAIRDELAVQLADMTRLHALGARLSNSLDLATVLEEVLSAVTELQGTELGVLMLHDRGRDVTVTAASVGFTAEEIDTTDGAAVEILPGESFTAIISGGLLVEDARTDPVLVPHLAAALRAGCHAVCSTPLLTSGGELIGTIATYFDRRHLPTDRETRLVELYARQAAEFIDNARLYREIREADRHKDEFLAMLAHELRNPLAPLMNALHMLRPDGLGGPEAEQVREIAERQVRHLTRLVDDLLDVSRISSGKIQLRKGPVDLNAIIGRAVDSARLLIESRRHELTVTTPGVPILLEADAARLEQVVSNLLNNAAKYTEPGGRIELEAAREGDEAVVRIRDTGIGIAPELLPCVFDLFTQAERSLDRSQGGLGIGLTLVRRLVELHDGSVAASSAGVGRGSEFVVRLPSGPATVDRRAPQRLPEGRRPRPAEATRKRVLVVDDNEDGARLLARLLRASGHQAELAHDGPTGLEAAISNPPDVVLLDIGLPGMDGFEVARRLREIEGPNRALLVALTGYGRDDDIRRSREAGFDHHMVKPVDPQALSDLLARHHPLVPQALD